MSDENPTPSQYPLGEPSVLDYVKSLFRSGNGERFRFLFSEETIDEDVEERQYLFRETSVAESVTEVEKEPSFWELTSTEPEPSPEPAQTAFPWRSLLAMMMGLVAQSTFEPPHITTEFGLALYVGTFSLLGWALYHGEWTLSPLAPTFLQRSDPLTYRGFPLLISLGFGALAFSMFGGNLFTTSNVVIWVLAVAFLIWAFWLNNKESLWSTFGSLGSSLQRRVAAIYFSRWAMLLVAALLARTPVASSDRSNLVAAIGLLGIATAVVATPGPLPRRAACCGRSPAGHGPLWWSSRPRRPPLEP